MVRLLALLALPALHVQVEADAQAGPCAPGAALEAALRSRLPGVRVEREAAVGAADLMSELRPEGPGWRLLLRRSGGETALSRPFALAASDCKLAAQTAALMVDRFLAEVRWPGRPASIEPLPRPPPPPPPPAVLDPAIHAPAPLPPRPAAHRHRLALALGPAAWLGAPSDLRAAALLAAEVRAFGSFEIGMVALLAATSSEDVTIDRQLRGQIRVQSALWMGAASACAEAARFRFCGGALFGGRGSLGSAAGDLLFRRSSRFLLQPEAGLRARADWRLSSRFALGIDLIGARALTSASFVVGGAPAPRALATYDVGVALRLAWEAL